MTGRAWDLRVTLGIRCCRIVHLKFRFSRWNFSELYVKCPLAPVIGFFARYNQELYYNYIIESWNLKAGNEPYDAHNNLHVFKYTSWKYMKGHDRTILRNTVIPYLSGSIAPIPEARGKRGIWPSPEKRVPGLFLGRYVDRRRRHSCRSSHHSRHYRRRHSSSLRRRRPSPP